jgi:hypothetical protein
MEGIKCRKTFHTSLPRKKKYRFRKGWRMVYIKYLDLVSVPFYILQNWLDQIEYWNKDAERERERDEPS